MLKLNDRFYQIIKKTFFFNDSFIFFFRYLEKKTLQEFNQFMEKYFKMTFAVVVVYCC